MIIILSPIASIENTIVSVSGDVITVNATDYDFSSVTDSYTPAANDPFIGDVLRVDGEINVTVEYYYNIADSEDDQSLDISDYTFTLTSGDVPDPIQRITEES